MIPWHKIHKTQAAWTTNRLLITLGNFAIISQTWEFTVDLSNYMIIKAMEEVRVEKDIIDNFTVITRVDEIS